MNLSPERTGTSDRDLTRIQSTISLAQLGRSLSKNFTLPRSGWRRMKCRPMYLLHLHFMA